MEITDEIWTMFGFKKESSVGGAKRWYYQKKYFPESFRYIKSPGSVSNGYLGFWVKETGKPDREPKDVQELINYMDELNYEYGLFCGKEEIRSNFKSLLGFE